jgi:hypothetical protein
MRYPRDMGGVNVEVLKLATSLPDALNCLAH